ncbi:hypothetical protein K488DRAFT_78923 [Vararia minispora EC-137]|uniref:Uncharacterized protein n=1 Tax=Vararia minispora EC-137 TaxID=1314806 RepID=A0ACB8QIP0_9AGAM|nr:hypothetical protein K488DRAFT_78923 [Vararia minispora EC-137]
MSFMAFRQLLTDFGDQLHDENNPLTAASAKCNNSLDELITLAHSNLSTARSADHLPWRRLYTDASILRAIISVANLGDADMRGAELVALSSVAHLDHALVVAGAAGDGRYDLIISIIALVQKQYLLSPHLPSPTLYRNQMTPSSKPSRLMYGARPISRLDDAPSLSRFKRELINAPIVISRFARDWPAVKDHPWSSLDYLRAVAGRGRVVPVEVGSDYRRDDWYQELMPWEDFLASLAQPDASKIVYLAQHNLFFQFPSLRDDIVVPDYVYSAPEAPPDFKEYRPPSNPEQLIINAWLGPQGTTSPAHTDPFFNFYVQVVGRKTVWLAPPSVASHMYSYPPPSSSFDKSRNPALNSTEPSMSNTSRVDVFATGTGDSDDFPAFTANAVPCAMHVTLEPGDALAFPPGWWHAMRSEEMSFSVSMWY